LSHDLISPPLGKNTKNVATLEIKMKYAKYENKGAFEEIKSENIFAWGVIKMTFENFNNEPATVKRKLGFKESIKALILNTLVKLNFVNKENTAVKPI
jgi:hypothetical protein